MKDEEELREQLNVAAKKVAKVYKKLRCIQKIEDSLNQRCVKETLKFKKLDRELAMIDGRYQVIPTIKPRVSKKKEVVLTKEQVFHIAKQLGIEIREKEVESKDNNDEEKDYENYKNSFIR